MSQACAVLVMAYGAPRNMDEVAAYYTHIRGGRPPSPAQLAELEARYRAIGGRSPLPAITAQQADALAQALQTRGWAARVYIGYKHAAPWIADAVERLAADGMQEAVALVLAPHYSALSVGTYLQAAEQACARHPGVRLLPVDSWHLQPRFIRLLAQRVRNALATWPAAPDPPMVVFTAHSLPERILAMGDPYPRQLAESAAAVAQAAGLPHYTLAWQSAGRTQERWLGPDILETLRSLHTAGHKRVVVCPAGFVSDHLEVLYDVDIECQSLAQSLGMELVRTASLNADPDLIAALADVVEERWRKCTGQPGRAAGSSAATPT
ncbi:MAG: ferrochelatase [Alicyclobacillus sp.]|nr:ferrochelatase [Alicyclobacillus sp.]